MLGTYVHESPRSLELTAYPVQHKPEIGDRRVKKIEVFLADTAASNLREPSLWWELEDSPKGEDRPMGW